jgi:hypothetical protein
MRRKIMPDQKLHHAAASRVARNLAQKIEVEVIVTRHEDKGVDFVCLWQDASNIWHSGPIVFPRNSGEHDIELKLDDRSGLNLVFESAATDAIWFNVDCCPTSASGDDKGQIRDKQVVAGRKKITLKNLNSGNPCVLHYALNFTGDSWTNPGSTQSYAYDPEFRNRGGTSR